MAQQTSPTQTTNSSVDTFSEMHYSHWGTVDTAIDLTPNHKTCIITKIEYGQTVQHKIPPGGVGAFVLSEKE